MTNLKPLVKDETDMLHLLVKDHERISFLSMASEYTSGVTVKRFKKHTRLTIGNLTFKGSDLREVLDKLAVDFVEHAKNKEKT